MAPGRPARTCPPLVVRATNSLLRPGPPPDHGGERQRRTCPRRRSPRPCLGRSHLLIPFPRSSGGTYRGTSSCTRDLVSLRPPVPLRDVASSLPLEWQVVEDTAAVDAHQPGTLPRVQ